MSALATSAAPPPAGRRRLLLDELHHVLVGHGVPDADALRRVLGAGAPHERVLERRRQRAVDRVAHVLDRDALRTTPTPSPSSRHSSTRVLVTVTAWLHYRDIYLRLPNCGYLSATHP